MTDDDLRAWWGGLPPDVEWLTPPGTAGGLFGDTNPGGGRCRPGDPADLEHWPQPPGCVVIEFWAGGPAWVPLTELVTWTRYEGGK